VEAGELRGLSENREEKLQIPPLRYASVGMTKGRVALSFALDDRMDREELSVPIANCTPTNEPFTLSSRPERSEVEGSAVSLLGFSVRL
jgi:hypothetical protein